MTPAAPEPHVALLLLLTPDESIRVMDVGAAAIAETPIYANLRRLGRAHLHAFEGDARQIKGIRAAWGERATIHRDFPYEGNEQTLNVCSGPRGMTSLLTFFNDFEQFGHVEKTQRVSTHRLDDIAGLPAVDFLKMGLQGAELAVLQNGTEKLRDCVAIQLEVSWICLYENQAAFGKLDIWPRAQGYVPHRFLNVKRWSIAPTIFKSNFRVPGNQLLKLGIVYVRDHSHSTDSAPRNCHPRARRLRRRRPVRLPVARAGAARRWQSA